MAKKGAQKTRMVNLHVRWLKRGNIPLFPLPRSTNGSFDLCLSLFMIEPVSGVTRVKLLGGH